MPPSSAFQVSFPELRAAWETQPSLQSLLPGGGRV